MAASLLKACAALVAFAIVGGCGVIPPRVGYQTYSDQARSGGVEERRGYLFRHRRSVLLVQVNRNQQFEVAVAPFELASDNTYTRLYEIAGGDDFRSTTQLKVTYIDNTKFIDEIKVTTKDNVAETIAKIGEVAKALAPSLAGGTVDAAAKHTGKPFVPTMLDPMASGVDQWRADPLNEGYCVRLRDTAVESRVTIEGYVAAMANRLVGTFPVPACATGIVEIAAKCDPLKPQEAKPAASIRVTFAHHSYVVPTPLPSTGSMKMHTVCGASVTPADNQDRTDILDHLLKAIKTVQDVHSAWQAKDGTAKPAPDKPAADKPKPAPEKAAQSKQ